jgi:uncharacterized protein
MARVVHFEITAENPERAVHFYEQALGWRIQRWAGPSPYWLVSTGDDGAPGIDGAIMDRPAAGQSMINIVSVPQLEAAMDSVRQAGGAVVGEVHLIPDVGRFVYVTDTEGNRFGLMEDGQPERVRYSGPAPRIV